MERYFWNKNTMLWISVWIGIGLSLTAAVASESAIEVEEIVDNVNSEEISNEQKMDVNNQESNPKLPTPAELLKILDSIKNMSDNDKNDLRDHFMKSRVAGDENNISRLDGKNFFYQMGLLLSLLSVITIIFVFFGFKLYKSLVEKEKRRELKRKQRELKKKK